MENIPIIILSKKKATGKTMLLILCEYWLFRLKVSASTPSNMQNSGYRASNRNASREKVIDTNYVHNGTFMHPAICIYCQLGGNINQNFFYILQNLMGGEKSPHVKHNSLKSTRVGRICTNQDTSESEIGHCS